MADSPTASVGPTYNPDIHWTQGILRLLDRHFVCQVVGRNKATEFLHNKHFSGLNTALAIQKL